MPCLLHAHYHVVLGVQEGRNQLQAVALQHLNVQRHTLGVALHCPHLHTSQIQLIFATCINEAVWSPQLHKSSFSPPAPVHVNKNSHQHAHVHRYSSPLPTCASKLFTAHACTHAPDHFSIATTHQRGYSLPVPAHMHQYSHHLHAPKQLHILTNTALHCQHAPQSCLLPTPAHMHRTNFSLQQCSSIFIYWLRLYT